VNGLPSTLRRMFSYAGYDILNLDKDPTEENIVTPKRFQLLALVGVLLATTSGSLAGPILARQITSGSILGSLEDGPGSAGFEHNGDFNDIIFQLTGDVSINAPSGVWSSLTPGVVNENGTVFWDNKSEDGSDMNIGYCLLGEAICSGSGPLSGTYEYLATPRGGNVDSVSFDTVGAVTLTVLGGVTATPGNILGWYNLDNPGVLYSLFRVPADSAGETARFTPDGAFALYSTNGGGQLYSTISSRNMGEDANQQHFAFFVDPPINAVPEPSTVTILGIGLALLGVGACLRRK
jgi:hypothetical protein